MVPGKQCDLWSRYNRYFNRNATSQRMAVAAFARAIRLHPKYGPRCSFCDFSLFTL
jgi:hypothetical protein